MLPQYLMRAVLKRLKAQRIASLTGARLFHSTDVNAIVTLGDKQVLSDSAGEIFYVDGDRAYRINHRHVIVGPERFYDLQAIDNTRFVIHNGSSVIIYEVNPLSAATHPDDKADVLKRNTRSRVMTHTDTMDILQHLVLDDKSIAVLTKPKRSSDHIQLAGDSVLAVYGTTDDMKYKSSFCVALRHSGKVFQLEDGTIGVIDRSHISLISPEIGKVTMTLTIDVNEAREDENAVKAHEEGLSLTQYGHAVLPPAFVVSGNQLIYADAAGVLHAVDAHGNTRVFNEQFKQEPTSAVFRVLTLMPDSGRIVATDAVGRELTTFSADGEYLARRSFKDVRCWDVMPVDGEHLLIETGKGVMIYHVTDPIASVTPTSDDKRRVAGLFKLGAGKYAVAIETPSGHGYELLVKQLQREDPAAKEMRAAEQFGVSKRTLQK